MPGSGHKQSPSAVHRPGHRGPPLPASRPSAPAPSPAARNAVPRPASRRTRRSPRSRQPSLTRETGYSRSHTTYCADQGGPHPGCSPPTGAGKPAPPRGARTSPGQEQTRAHGDRDPSAADRHIDPQRNAIAGDLQGLIRTYLPICAHRAVGTHNNYAAPNGGYRSPGGRQCELHPVTGGRWCLAPRREHRRPVPGKTMTG